MNRDWANRDEDETPEPHPEAPMQPATAVFRVPRKPGTRTADWFYPTLAEAPHRIAFLKRMAVSELNSIGYPLTDHQRKWAADTLRGLEDFLGEAV